MTMHNVPNRLAKEKSPYLLQHAYNPVDWFPWSDEAFAIAKRDNKPVSLLGIADVIFHKYLSLVAIKLLHPNDIFSKSLF